MNPYSKLQEQIEIGAMVGANDPVDYYEAGRLADWLLIIAQGIKFTQQYCLASTGNLFQYIHRDTK